MPRIQVLRLGHRLVRDDRVTTHVGLAARAFGADRIHLLNCDPDVKHRIDRVTSKWGGKFEAEVTEEWRGLIGSWKERGGLVIHLTMYGINLDNVITSIRNSKKDLLLLISAEKAPREAFDLSDYNVAIGHQPHSEVAALAIFLDRYFEGVELKRDFQGSKVQIIPSARGKELEMSR